MQEAVSELIQTVSEAKLLANRQNSLSSTGPKTPEGKRRSSLNAVRHSITGQIVCKTAEELEHFNRHCAAVNAEWLPQGPTEEFLTQSIAENMLRLNRARAIENGIFASGFRTLVEAIESGHPEVDTALAQSETFIAQCKVIATLAGYEQKIRRALEKDTAALETRQANRKAAYAIALKEATDLATHAEYSDKDYEPGEDFLPASDHGGFVFTYDAILKPHDRAKRLRAARDFLVHGPKRPPAPVSDPKKPENNHAA